MRHSRLLFVLAVLAVLAAIPTLTMANHSWGSYHWARTANPFTLKLGDNVTTAWDSYLAQASTDWTASSVLNTTIVAGGTTPRRCSPTAGRVEVCNEAYGNNGWLGLASIWANGNHITQGTAKMNDSYFNTATYNTPAWRRLVMCQEVAHTFGLDHQDEVFDNANLGSCMDYTNDPDGGAGGASSSDPSNEHPNAHDFDQLVTIYSHLDSTTTVGAALPTTMAPAMRNFVLDSVDNFGPIVKAIKNGPGLITYHVQDFGRGQKIITHVFWALDNHHNH
jgi:hypothetical protein